MGSKSPLLLGVDDNNQVYVANYVDREITRDEEYDVDSFLPFETVSDFLLLVDEVRDTGILNSTLCDLAYDATEPPFDKITERGKAKKRDYDPEGDWYDFVEEEDLEALNKIVAEWAAEPLSGEECNFSTTPTDAYDCAWSVLVDCEYDTDAIGLEFVEGMGPGDDNRYVFLRMEIDKANEICERESIDLRFERGNSEQQQQDRSVHAP